MFVCTQSGTLLAGGIYLSTGNGALIGIGGLLVYLLAGLCASQHTGRVATRTLAGLWTGLISVVITWVYTIVFVSASVSLGQNSQASSILAIFVGAQPRQSSRKESSSLYNEEREVFPPRARGWIIWHVLEHAIHHGGELSLALGEYGLETHYIH